jgi:hypothetical protein
MWIVMVVTWRSGPFGRQRNVTQSAEYRVLRRLSEHTRGTHTWNTHVKHTYNNFDVQLTCSLSHKMFCYSLVIVELCLLEGWALTDLMSTPRNDIALVKWQMTGKTKLLVGRHEKTVAFSIANDACERTQSTSWEDGRELPELCADLRVNPHAQVNRSVKDCSEYSAVGTARHPVLSFQHH